MEEKVNQQKLKTAIKALLKRKNHTYADVAKVWKCSVPTVKRQLGPEELTLTRLLTLLDWLDVSLAELQKLAASNELERSELTERQNRFLADNPLAFSFLLKIYDGLTVEEITRKYKLKSDAVERILIQLEKYDLIRIGAGGRVKPYHSRMPTIGGPLAQKRMSRVIDRAAEFQKLHVSEMLAKKARGLDVPLGTLAWQISHVTERTYNEYFKHFVRLMSDFESAARLEVKLHKKSELKTAIANLGFFICENNDPHLHVLTETIDDGLKVE